MAKPKVAFIGGSGLYDLDGLTDRSEHNLDTPFGAPSDAVVTGTLNGTTIAFLARHGRGHRFSPSEIPVRANIHALKSLGVEHIISMSAVGSLKAEIKPLDVVVPDQLIDRTKTRNSTFFDGGIAAHIGFADPFCPTLSDVVAEVAEQEGVTVHSGGSYVVIEGPQFSTRAESELYRSWGASVIGMTALPEAKLAREAEICYATVAQVTDYDTWHEHEESVSVELVVGNLRRLVAACMRIIRVLAGRIPESRKCECASALDNAIITTPEFVPRATRERLSLLMDRYLQVSREVG